MFGLILFVLVLSSVGLLFSRPYYGYYRPRVFPYSGFGGWGMGRPYGPMMHHGPCHHHHHMGHGPMGHGPMGHGHMGHGRRW